MSAKRDIFGLRMKGKNEEKHLLRPASLHNVTMSPMKSCMNFVVENSPKTQQNQLMKSPSPKKLIQRSVTCRNLGILLKTPEKENIGSDTDFDKVQNDLAEQPESSVIPPPVPVKKRKSSTKLRVTKSEGVGDNFVRINLRRKVFAPQSRPNFKRKWSKRKKRNGARK